MKVRALTVAERDAGSPALKRRTSVIWILPTRPTPLAIYIRNGYSRAWAVATQGLIPLTPVVLHILLALADGERHGYAIAQEVEETTDGQIRMGPGTLYGSIQRMLTPLIEETPQRRRSADDDERRRYYRMTALGKRALELGAAAARRSVVRLAQTKHLLRDPGRRLMTPPVVASSAATALAMLIYPPAFRARFGEEMIGVRETARRRRAARDRGTPPYARRIRSRSRPT